MGEGGRRADGRAWFGETCRQCGIGYAMDVAEAYADEYADGELPGEFGQGVIEACDEWIEAHGDNGNDKKGCENDGQQVKRDVGRAYRDGRGRGDAARGVRYQRVEHRHAGRR